MDTKTNIPTTAAEAQALADKLAAAEGELAARRRAARRGAAMNAADDLLEGPSRDLLQSVHAADTALRETIANPDAGITELFNAWQTLRINSATRVAHDQAAAGLYDSYLAAKANDPQELRRLDRVARTDSSEHNYPSFEAILTEAVRARAQTAAYTWRESVAATIHDAADKAEAKVK